MLETRCVTKVHIGIAHLVGYNTIIYFMKQCTEKYYYYYYY
jgi:hypothetical protein